MMQCTIYFFNDVTDRLQCKTNLSKLVLRMKLIDSLNNRSEICWRSQRRSQSFHQELKKAGVKANAVKNLGSNYDMNRLNQISVSVLLFFLSPTEDNFVFTSSEFSFLFLKWFGRSYICVSFITCLEQNVNAFFRA